MATKKVLPSKEFLNECFDYVDGVLYWKRHRPLNHFKTTNAMKSFNSKLGGKPAGVNHNGYISIGLNETNYKGHLLIWKLLTGNDPIESIYHLNFNVLDNRIENLADGNMKDIGKIKPIQSNNTSGYIGVSFDSTHSAWKACITRNNIKYNLGTFSVKEDAIKARLEAEKETDFSKFVGSNSKTTRLNDIKITKDIVDMLLKYEDGKLYWKERFEHDGFYSKKSCTVFNSQFAGKEAGSLDATYLKVELFGKKYKVHRLIWLLFNNKDPKNLIDHIDGNKLNNRIENLREADYTTNGMNRKSHYNKEVSKGVSFVKKDKKYVARIMADGNSIYLGRFDDEETAKQAYDEAAVKLHGSFANLG